MKIYTKRGDSGETELIGGYRLSKASARVDVYGSLDELNSMIGVARAHSEDDNCVVILLRIQQNLFDICSELACPPDKVEEFKLRLLPQKQTLFLESTIDELQQDLIPSKGFILPGGSEEASFLHVARTICRKAERKLVSLTEKEAVRPEILQYLNRLSDLLFVLARHANYRAKVEDVLRKKTSL